MQNELDLEARRSHHTEIKDLLQSFLCDKTQTATNKQEMLVHHQSTEDSSLVTKRITRPPNEAQSQEDKRLTRKYSGQTPQFLQIQQGIDDIKALMMSVQSSTAGPFPRNELEISSIASTYSFWSREIRKLLVSWLL